MEKRILAIVNPLSANGVTAKEWPGIQKEIEKANIFIDVEYTKYPTHATEIARKALKSCYDIILSVGGDGTINEILNGFFENNYIIRDNAYLGVLSKGTGCDFSRTLNLGDRANDIIKILTNINSIECDVGKGKFVNYDGKVTERYFLNISDVGIGAETTFRVNRNSKILKGFLSFLLGAVFTILTFKNKNLQITIDEDIKINGKKSCVVVANGKYFGGGMLVAPNAELDDGLFDVVILGDFTKLEFLANFPKIYKGTHLEHLKVDCYRGRKVRISSSERVLIEFDGEQPGIIDAEFEIIPKAIKVLI